MRRSPRFAMAKRTVYTLAALFSLDAFGGGLIVQSMLALWLFQRYGLSTSPRRARSSSGPACCPRFRTSLPRRSRANRARLHDGLHAPAVERAADPRAVAPDLATSVALLLVRSALSQMDVPTRSSFVMAIVPPGERAAAASLTAVPRSLAAASSPLARRLSARHLHVRLAADHRGRIEDRVRPHVARALQGSRRAALITSPGPSRGRSLRTRH